MRDSPAPRPATAPPRRGAQREICRRLHLDQPRHRPLELERAVAGRVEARRLGIGGGEQLDLVLVQLVDQRDEARRLVAVLRPHDGHADEDERVELARDGEIIRRAERRAAQAGEREHRDALDRLGHEQRPAAGDGDGLGRHAGAVLDREVGQAEESLRQRLRRRRPVRHVPGRRAAEPVEAVVDRAVERHHLQPRLDQVDERQEQRAVEPVLVEVGGRPVGCGDDTVPASNSAVNSRDTIAASATSRTCSSSKHSSLARRRDLRRDDGNRVLARHLRGGRGSRRGPRA